MDLSSLCYSFFLIYNTFIQFILKKYYKFFMNANLSFILLFGLIAPIIPFYDLFDLFKLTEEEARTWIAIIALPLSIFLWWLFENNKIEIKKSFLISCVFSTLSLTAYRVGSDYQFYQFQKQFSKKLTTCKDLFFGVQ